MVVLNCLLLNCLGNQIWAFIILLARFMVQLVVMEINDVNWTGLGLCPRAYSHKHNALTNCRSFKANCGEKPSPDFLSPPRETWLETCFHAWLGWWRLANSMSHHWPSHDGLPCPWQSFPVKIFRSSSVIFTLLVYPLWGSVSKVRIKHILIERDIRWNPHCEIILVNKCLLKDSLCFL